MGTRSEWQRQLRQDAAAAVAHPLQRSRFEAVTQHLLLDVCQKRLPDHDEEWDLVLRACMFIASCFCLAAPMTFRSEQHHRHVHTVVRWMSPRQMQAPDVAVLRELARHRQSVCHLVLWKQQRMLVRKRIPPAADRVPHYTALVEVVVHRMLLGTEHPHVVRLEGSTVHANGMVDLYYEYIPIPLHDPQVDGFSRHALICDLLRGVCSLHARNIAHRDLKLTNIHVRSHNAQLVLLDLGAAGYGATRTTVPACTITYRSPDMLQAELRAGGYEYDPQALDMWSVGILILQLVLGESVLGTPTADTTPEDMLALLDRHLGPACRQLRACGVLTPPQCERTMQCLAFQPQLRPTARAMLDTFER